MLELNQIYNTDALEGLKQLDENSIDAIVSDPPYQLTSTRVYGKETPISEISNQLKDNVEENTAYGSLIKGFMNKSWDVLPSVDILKECLRVLKSGAWALWLMTPRQDSQLEFLLRLRQAGFNISFSSVEWVYACLSSDTEVFTPNGWIKWEQLHKTNQYKYIPILIYDYETDNYKWEIPSQWNEYSINDTCYRIKSDFTDQLVSRGHRVYFEREGNLLWEFAEKIYNQKSIKVPILDEVPDVRQYNFPKISSSHNKNNMLKGMYEQILFQYEQRQSMGDFKNKKGKKDLSMLRKGVLYISSMVKKREKLWYVLFNKLQAKSKYSQILTRMAENPQDKMDRGKKRESSADNDGFKKLGLERWSYLLQNTWKLYWDKICSLPERIYIDGSQRRLCYGTPLISSTANWETSIAKGSSASYRPQSSEQFTIESHAFQYQPRTQAIRTPSKSYKTAMATITKQHYKGIIFCPTVSSGIFIARRKGKIFLTGNSGFPKAADLSLLADKRACRENLTQKLGREPTKEEFKEAWNKWREKIAVNPNSRLNEGENPFTHLAWKAGKNVYETNPHSPEAQALSGSYAGMQLKPARELIIVSQKPLAGKTYLDQALLHLKEPEHNQLGGSYIDDCRIPINKERESDSRVGTDIKRGYKEGIIKDREASSYNVSEYGVQMYKDDGRFPANIIVSDNALDIGIKKKSAKVDSIGGFGAGLVNYERGYDDSGDLSRYFDLDFWFENKLKELPEEQQKIFPFLYVPKASKSERNKGLENMPDRYDVGVYGDGIGNVPKEEGQRPNPYKNIHPTAKPIKLMSYLITLTTRENDIVLDPFTGSGTTAISSILLRRRFIGFEREEEYYKIATERIKHYQKQEML